MSNMNVKCRACDQPAKCKGLCKKHYDASRRADPEIKARFAARAKEYRVNNKEKMSIEYKKWYQGQGREYDRDRGLRYRYGIGIEVYDLLFKKQEGRCAVCQTLSPGDDNYHFHVDHDHKTGEIRGLLCGTCNKMLGQARDTPETLRLGASYLERKHAPKVKQVIVMRRKFKDKNGQSMEPRRGKMIAQGAHASLAFMIDKVIARKPLTEVEGIWLDTGTAKVCLQVESEEELLEIYKKAQDAGLEVHMVTDAGLTEFDGVPTKTCLAIGPDESMYIDKITGELKLY